MMIDALKVKPKAQDESWGQYYQKNSLQFGALLFVGGFILDVFTLADIEDPINIAQQIFYLSVIVWVLYYEIVQTTTEWQPSGFGLKLWNIREALSHFCLGSLLNIYSLFFFKSASLSSSIFFILFLAALLVLNEIPAFQARGPVVRLTIWTLCLATFFVQMTPLIIGSVGFISFVLSVMASALVLYVLFKLFQSRGDIQFAKARLLMVTPLAALGFYIFAFMFKLIPPVPLALKEIGIYHKVEKVEGEYIRTEEKPWWRFWHNGDQHFVARPGDKIYVYAAIHSPTRISNQVRIKWHFKDPRNGWMVSDDIPMQISGGRREGFRGVSYKSNYQSGQWRVSIETPEGLEIGRISLTVEKTEAQVTPSKGSLSEIEPSS